MEQVYLDCGRPTAQLMRDSLGRCDYYMNQPDTPSPEFRPFQESGAEFEAALRAAGVQLPSSITGAELLQAIKEEILRHLISHPKQNRHVNFSLQPVVSMIRELNVEPSDGISNQTFADSLLLRVRKWARARAATLW